jgi:hypothetical protein
MNTRKIATLVALGAVALMAGAGSAGASDPGNTNTTIVSLDGHCDVLTLTVFPWHQAGMSQVCNGTMTGVGAGMEGNVRGFVSPKDLTIGEVYSPGPPGTIYLWTFQYPLQTGGTWSIYSYVGASLNIVDSGTYTVTNADAAPIPHEGSSAIPAARK